jgi:hypothetical protein
VNARFGLVPRDFTIGGGRKRGQSMGALLNTFRRMPLNFRALARLALLASLPAAISLTAPAQNAFSPGGDDYAIAGARLGDQTAPHAAIAPAGGWLVWQDNAADGNGLGISAARLDAGLALNGAAFRVNAQGALDQEKPRVARLASGGAVVVWQGGPLGFQDIYARFLNADGSFATGDILVNTHTNQFQIDPSVAVLANGTVVVVWASSQQDGSLQGVYAQRFDAAGQKLGAEFRVNQFTGRNQRTPAVAALADGNFAVAWISELQRSAESVDVYARVFTAAGAAATGELQVNPTPVGICANPAIAASASGGFAVAWSQKGGVFHTSAGDRQATQARTDGWDVAARLFTSAGAGAGGAIRLNTVGYGDQYGPQISAFGKNYLASWVSLGQDGAREGIYGQFLNGSGGLEGVEFRVNTATASRQMHPAIASDAVNRFLVLWSTFQAGSSFDLFARHYELIRMTMAPEAGGVRLTWNTQPGNVYQVQSSANMQADSWTNVGGERTAGVLSDSVWLNPAPDAAYFRVIRLR